MKCLPFESRVVVPGEFVVVAVGADIRGIVVVVEFPDAGCGVAVGSVRAGAIGVLFPSGNLSVSQ